MTTRLNTFFLLSEQGPFDAAGNGTKLGKLNFDSEEAARDFARTLWKNAPGGRPDRLVMGQVIEVFPVKEWQEMEQTEEILTQRTADVDRLVTKVQVLEDQIFAAQTPAKSGNKLQDRIQARMGLLGLSIDELQLSRRIVDCLSHAGMRTVGDLIKKTEQELREIKGFGPFSLMSIKGSLAKRHLKLATVVNVRDF